MSTVASAFDLNGRGFAIAGAAMIAVGLLGAAAVSGRETQLPPKATARAPSVVALAKPRIVEPFAPRAEIVDQQVSALKAGLAWNLPKQPATLALTQPQYLAQAAVDTKAAARSKVAVAPLPPRRPAALQAKAAATPEGPPVFVAAEEPRARIGSFELPQFVPTGASIVRRIGDVGSSIGSVGSSIGKLMRISSR